jgi:hydrogenase maturation protease
MTTGVSIKSENRSVVLIGLGNPSRRDDGIGPSLLTGLDPELLWPVTLVMATRDPTVLLEAWADADLAVVVDAAVCRPPTPGRIHRCTTCLTSGARVVGNSHGFRIFDAIRLATVLNRAPRRLVVLAVEAADLTVGYGLSPPVAAAIPALTAAVLREIGAATRVLPRGQDPRSTGLNVAAVPAPIGESSSTEKGRG